MASSSGATSSGSSLLQNSGSETDLKAIMDQKKRKRMISNRESARRSRMRKQKHLDDLMKQVSVLRQENHQIITTMNITTQHYLNVEAENSVLRAQICELGHRLESLYLVTSFMEDDNNSNGDFGYSLNENFVDGFLNLSWNLPIMASADVIQY